MDTNQASEHLCCCTANTTSNSTKIYIYIYIYLVVDNSQVTLSARWKFSQSKQIFNKLQIVKI